MVNRKENFKKLKKVALTPYPRKSFTLGQPTPQTRQADHAKNIRERKIIMSKNDWVYMHKIDEKLKMTTKKALYCYSKFVCQRYTYLFRFVRFGVFFSLLNKKSRQPSN